MATPPGVCLICPFSLGVFVEGLLGLEVVVTNGVETRQVQLEPLGLCPPPLIPEALSSNVDIIKVSPKRQQVIEKNSETGHRR